MALSYSISGIEDADIKNNVRLLLDNTEFSAQSTVDPFWQKQVSKLIADAVEPFGYYSSDASFSQTDDEVIIAVSLGPPIVITAINASIKGEGQYDETFQTVFSDRAFNQGDVLYQPDYEQYKVDVFNYALSNGYFDFFWESTRIDIDKRDNSAVITLIAGTGLRYLFGDIRIKGEPKSKPLLDKLRTFKIGETYSTDKLSEFNKLLNQTGYFTRVIARPVVKDAVDEQVPIEVELTHLPRDNFNVGIGYSTDTRLRVPLRWRRPWVNSRGHSLSSSLYLSEREQTFVADYNIPMEDVSNDFANFQIGYQFLDDSNRDTESETFSITGRRAWRLLESRWQYSVSLGFEREQFTQGFAESITTDLFLPGISASYVATQGDLNHREGFVLSTGLEVASDHLISDIDMIRATASAKWVKNYSDHRIKLSTEFGGIETNDFSRVPATRRFFTGGDQSVRGFSFESLTAGEFLDVDGEQRFFARGGRYLAVGSVEYAYQISEDWRIATFFDMGTATNDFDEGFARSIGIGAHWLSLIGPVRIYLASGQSNIDDERTFRLHLILGPEL